MAIVQSLKAKGKMTSNKEGIYMGVMRVTARPSYYAVLEIVKQ